MGWYNFPESTHISVKRRSYGRETLRATKGRRPTDVGAGKSSSSKKLPSWAWLVTPSWDSVESGRLRIARLASEAEETQCEAKSDGDHSLALQRLD